MEIEDDDETMLTRGHSSFDTVKKTFFKRTRKGHIVRLVHDKYIRNDIECGYLFKKAIDAVSLRNLVSQAPQKQLLLVDTNIALHQIDVLEHQCPATFLVVILQTVLQELKHINLSVFRRVLAMLKDESKSYVFFPNELCAQTAVLRSPSESINDSNDRSIRMAALYFNTLLDDSGEVVLVTNDVDNQRKAKLDRINAMSLRKYVEQFSRTYPVLLDLLAADNQSATTMSSNINNNNRRAIYPAHLPIGEILPGIKAKKYLRGTIRVKRDCWWETYVVVHTTLGSGSGSGSGDIEVKRTVTITGKLRLNRAVDGDVVAIELLSTAEDKLLEDGEDRGWSSDVPDMRLVDRADSAAIAAETSEATPEAMEGLQQGQGQGQGQVVAATGAASSAAVRAALQGDGPLFGRVVGIIRRNWRQYAGSLDSSGASDRIDDSSNSTSTLFYPVDCRLPPVRLSTRRKEELVEQRLLVAIDQWPADSMYPLGHYSRVLGKDGDREVEAQVLLHEFDVPCQAFTGEVMACLPAAGWTITADVVADRRDLRHLPVSSIDPPGCKDIDDALHCIRLSNGNYEAGVHIADVTHFVHPDTPLDKEAAHRSTSTYLVERRLDMLPTLLTTQLCSLRSSEDHLAFSIIWELTEEGEIVDTQFFKSVIRSKASLTYDEAQAMLDDPSRSDDICDSVRLLNKFSRIFRQKRFDQGALTLASPEVRFKLDTETLNPTDVSIYSLKEANSLVEEWMLQANITVSLKILKHFPTLAVLRRHQPPSPDQFEPLLKAARSVGVYLDISSSKALADTLDKAVKTEDPYFNKLLRILATRCMMPAQYFCSGEIPKDQWHHYGLAAPVYSHFTSPIRRYADVIVHRLLAAAIGVIPIPPGNADRSRQQEVCSHLNRRHKAAQYAQRASVNLYTLLYFRHRPSTEAAYVLSISRDKFSVLVPRFGIEGTILLDPIVDMVGGTVSINEETCSLTISNENAIQIQLQVFQKVEVSIAVVETRAGSRKLVVRLVIDGKVIGTVDTTTSNDSSQAVEAEGDLETENSMVGVAENIGGNSTRKRKIPAIEPYSSSSSSSTGTGAKDASSTVAVSKKKARK